MELGECAKCECLRGIAEAVAAMDSSVKIVEGCMDDLWVPGGGWSKIIVGLKMITPSRRAVKIYRYFDSSTSDNEVL